MTIVDALRGIKGTLNEVTVKGEENLDRVLACIRLLNQCITNIENSAKKEEANNEKGSDLE
jgi:hypothetical protein